DAGMRYRDVNGKPADTVTISLKEGARSMPVRGFQWDADETRIAIAAGRSIYLHDVKAKTTKVLVTLGEDDKSVTAEPDWRGGDVICTLYTDIGAPFKR